MQIDSFGRVMAIDMSTIAQYTGEESSEYQHTLYKKMENAGTFTGGIPAQIQQQEGRAGKAGGSQASTSTGAAEWADASPPRDGRVDAA